MYFFPDLMESLYRSSLPGVECWNMCLMWDWYFSAHWR